MFFLKNGEEGRRSKAIQENVMLFLSNYAVLAWLLLLGGHCLWTSEKSIICARFHVLDADSPIYFQTVFLRDDHASSTSHAVIYL